MPGQGNSYYTQQNFGNQPYYQTQRNPVVSAPVRYRDVRVQAPQFITSVPQYRAPQPVYQQPVYYRPQVQQPIYQQPVRAVSSCQAPWRC